ncbi:hypothetical protein VTI74DRAFT_7647 [Chaetomium olivicolor]
MAPSLNTFRLAQGTTLLLSSFSSGVSLAFSCVLVPRLLESPSDIMLTQWLHTYALGAATMPLAAAATTAGYIFLGLRTPGISLFRSRMYLAAGALTVGIVPYTVLVMRGTNNRLRALEERASAKTVELPAPEVRAEEERTAKGLVDWWGVLNLGRTGLLVAGAVCGLVAAL